MKRGHTFLLTGFLVTGWVIPAHAQPRDPAAAEVLFKAGRAAMDAGDYATACPKFEESQRLDPAAGTMINLAECEARRGQLADSWIAWNTALSMLEAGDPRRPEVLRRLDELRARLPWMRVRLAASAPPDARVFRDGVELRPASLGISLPVNPGPHEVEVLANGRDPKHFTLELREGETAEVEVTAGAPIAERPAPPPQTAPMSSAAPVTADAAHRGRPQRWLGLGVAAAGLAGVATGAVTGLGAIAKDRELNDTCWRTGGKLYCDDAGLEAADAGQRQAQVSTIAFALGGTALVGGLVLVAIAPRDRGPKTSLTLAPTGVGLRRSF